MATFTWTGAAGDGNFATAGNWLGGAAPAADSQDYVFDRGDEDLTAGLTTSYSANSIIVTPGYSGKIGSSSAPLVFTSIASLKYGGTGQYAKFGSSGTITAATLDHAGGTFYASSGTWTTLTHAGAALSVEASAVVTTLRALGQETTVATNGTGITTLTAAAGSTTVTSRNVTTGNVLTGARLILEGTSATTKLNIYANGEVNDRATGTATHVEAFPLGRYRLAGLTGNKTITDRTRWAGASIDTVAAGVTVTLTNAETVIGASAAGAVPR